MEGGREETLIWVGEDLWMAHFHVDASTTAKRCERLSMIAAWFRTPVILDCQKSSGNIGASKEHMSTNMDEFAISM